MIVFTLAFAALFTVLKFLKAPVWAMVGLVFYLAALGLGQAVLYRGERPRSASMLATIETGRDVP